MPKSKEEVNVNCTAETFRREKTGKKFKYLLNLTPDFCPERFRKFS